MRSRHSDLRELRALLRAPEAGAYNLAEYMAVHGTELGLDPMKMTGPDEVVAPRILPHLERWREEERRTLADGILVIMEQLQSEVRWRGEQVVLPPVPFFRLTSSATGKKYIRFAGYGVDVTVSRHPLQRAGVALRALRDITVGIDGNGVHLGWGARGRLNFYPQHLKGTVDALIVSLPHRTAPRRMPVLLGEVLAEMGFGI